MAMSNPDAVSVHNGVCLLTQQRRLRHVHGIAVRNLTCDVLYQDIVNLQAYFTLHNPQTKKVLYTSEKITGSLNPTWQTFSVVADDNFKETSNTTIMIRTYAGIHETFRVIIEYTLHLSALEYLADQLERDYVKLRPNCLIFSLFNKYFTVYMESSASTRCDVTSTYLRVDTSAVRTSYPISSLLRLRTVLRAIKQTQTTVTRLRDSIEDRLVAAHRCTTKTELRERHVARVDQLRSELLWQSERLLNEKEAHYERSQRLHDSKNVLKDSYSRLRRQKEDFNEKLKQHNHTRENYVKVNAQLMMRRKQLIGELATFIYPVCNDSKGHMICGVHLADAEHLPARDDVSVAVALGYAGHLLLMMSQVLDQSLWYAVNHSGSRSEITDHILQKLPYKDRKFPLYWKGKEKLQFDYAVYLLNKNVCQLRFHCGMGTHDLRPTLSNLKSLLEVRFGVRTDQPIALVPSPQPNSDPGRRGKNSADDKKKHSSPNEARLLTDIDLQVHSSINGSPVKPPSASSLSLSYREGVRLQDDVTSSDDDLMVRKQTLLFKTQATVGSECGDPERGDLECVSDESNSHGCVSKECVLNEKTSPVLIKSRNYDSASNGDVSNGEVSNVDVSNVDVSDGDVSNKHIFDKDASTTQLTQNSGVNVETKGKLVNMVEQR